MVLLVVLGRVQSEDNQEEDVVEVWANQLVVEERSVVGPPAARGVGALPSMELPAAAGAAAAALMVLLAVVPAPAAVLVAPPAAMAAMVSPATAVVVPPTVAALLLAAAKAPLDVVEVPVEELLDMAALLEVEVDVELLEVKLLEVVVLVLVVVITTQHVA